VRASSLIVSEKAAMGGASKKEASTDWVVEDIRKAGRTKNQFKKRGPRWTDC